MLQGKNGVSIRGYCCRPELTLADKTNSFDKDLWKKAELTLIKSIKENKWPRIAKLQKQALENLLVRICSLSYEGNNSTAMELIDNYSFSPLIRCLAINKVRSNSGLIAGRDLKVIKNDIDKLVIYKQTNKLTYLRSSKSDIRRIELPKTGGGVRLIGISNIIERVLQTQICILLDAYYEAKYHENIFSYRKGRNSLQAISLLKRIVDSTDKKYLGVGLLDIKKCFDSIPHEQIKKHFLIPLSWGKILQRWLKPRLYGADGKYLRTLQCGVAQGSIIGPMICNVIVNKALFELSDVKLDGKYKLKIFNELPTNFQKTSIKSWSKIHRSIITYADDICVTTSNSTELAFLVKQIESALNSYGLELAMHKTQFIDYSKVGEKRIKFDYLGFTFNYIPKNKIRSGGILSRYNRIMAIKENLMGSHLLYPKKESFKNIKIKLKKCINKLQRLSVFEVINDINATLRRWVNYYGWANAEFMLRHIDQLIYKRTKAKLIKKFCKRGNYRVLWVMQKYFICNTKEKKDSKVHSPKGLRWHLHTIYPASYNKNKRLKTHFWLLFATNIWELKPINICLIPATFKNIPYYLCKNKYAEMYASIIKKRTNNKDFKFQLYASQKGICPYCKLSLENTNFNYKTTTWSTDLDTLEVHHIKSLAEGAKLSKKLHKKYDSFKNVILLHRECHIEITHKPDLFESTVQAKKVVVFEDSEKLFNSDTIRSFRIDK